VACALFADFILDDRPVHDHSIRAMVPEANQSSLTAPLVFSVAFTFFCTPLAQPLNGRGLVSPIGLVRVDISVYVIFPAHGSVIPITIQSTNLRQPAFVTNMVFSLILLDLFGLRMHQTSFLGGHWDAAAPITRFNWKGMHPDISALVIGAAFRSTTTLAGTAVHRYFPVPVPSA
jgi:hypothetical protein